MERSNLHRIAVLALLVILCSVAVLSANEEDVTVETEEEISQVEDDDADLEIPYTTPKIPQHAFLAETFDDITIFSKNWVISEALKDGVDKEIAKYDGLWQVEPPMQHALVGDRGLVLKSKAKHAAISIPLKRNFYFTKQPMILQYEVTLQNGQECGGAYIKLLSATDGGIDLKRFTDKTPYTIMFGPDKCGNDHKLHFIFRHVNPLNKSIEEKHAKRPSGKIDEAFNDKKSHLYTLILRPDNSYEISVDHQVINTGNLLDDMTPPVNPPKEIDDHNDFKPKDWDEREKIPDPEASKPVDWDDDAPSHIPDPTAVKPTGWLDDEPEMFSDPSAVRPEDWDNEMDGEWEAPLVANPKCSDAPGCGVWKPASIENPQFKGKWRAPMIDNPDYRGKWKPHKIPNPDFFEDLEPFKMMPIGAVGFELWSMSENILFDNILITDNIAEAYQFAAETYDLKVLKMEKGQAGIFRRLMNYSNKNPWLYGIYVLLIAIPVVLIFACCCVEDKKLKEGKKKKTDEPSEDDALLGEEKEDDGEEEKEDEEVVDKEETEEKEEEEVEVLEEEAPVRQSPRLRKSRKD